MSFVEHVNELCRTARVKNISLVRCAHSWNIFQHSKRNFVSPSGHVISSIYHIRNISRIRPCLSIDSTKTLEHALVTSRLDRCNSLLYGLPDYLIQRLQYVMNAAAKVITCKRKFDHVIPLLIELHWLPVRQRIVFKILLYTFKTLRGATPTHLTELISPYVPRRALRSADQLLLEQPTHKLKLIGLRAFSVCAPYLWNSLSFEIKSNASVSIFKAKLKTYLFRQTYF